MTSKRLHPLMILLLLAVACHLGGCMKVSRTPKDPPVMPPVDMAPVDWSATAAEVLTIENQIPPREAYIIGPGDQLSLQLLGRPDLLGLDAQSAAGQRNDLPLIITDSPTITLPYIGPVLVHGRTADEIQETIRVEFEKIVKNPIPVLTVAKYNDNMFSVVGSVRTPGRYQLEVGTTVLEAIFKAGGLTLGGGGGLPPARFMKIYRNKLTKREIYTLSPADLLTRLSSDGTVLTRREILLPLDEFLLGGDLTWNIPVQQNDIIYIPPAGTVSVHGNVANPRVVFLGPGLRTLVQVLTEAGGTRYSARSIIEVVRPNPDGTTDSYFINARRAMRRQVPDFYIQDNDQVFVYKSHPRNVLEFLGDLLTGGTRAGLSATYSPVP